MPIQEGDKLKLTHGYDHSHVVGEVFLSREIINELKRGIRFELAVEFRLPDNEILGLTLLPKAKVHKVNGDIHLHSYGPSLDGPGKIIKVEKQDEVIDSRSYSCKKCGADESSDGGWWHCCPEHTTQEPSDVVCTPCAFSLHPDWKH